MYRRACARRESQGMNSQMKTGGNGRTPDITWTFDVLSKCLEPSGGKHTVLGQNTEKSVLICTKRVACQIPGVKSVGIDDIDEIDDGPFDFLVCDEQDVNRMNMKELIAEGGQLLILSPSTVAESEYSQKIEEYLSSQGFVVNVPPIEMGVNMDATTLGMLFVSVYLRGRDCADPTCNSQLIYVEDNSRLGPCTTNCGRDGSYSCPNMDQLCCSSSICSTCFMRNQFAVRHPFGSGYDNTYMDMKEGDILHRKRKNVEQWSKGHMEGSHELKWFPPQFVL